MDSVTDEDIDRIFRRIEETIDLEDITTQTKLYQTINKQRSTRSWNNALNEAMYERLEEKRKPIEQLYRYKALLNKATQFIGVAKNKKYSMIYKKNGSTQLIARDAKGRFTKPNYKELINIL